MNPSEGALAITRGRMGTHANPVFRMGYPSETEGTK